MSNEYDTVRAGFAGALGNVSGLTAYERWPETCEASLPAAAPVLARADFTDSFEDDATLYVDVVLLAARASVGFQVGQAAVDAFLSASGNQSIRAALEEDPTLGGAVTSVVVTGWDDYRFDWKIAPNGPDHWGVRFRCEVLL